MENENENKDEEVFRGKIIMKNSDYFISNGEIYFPNTFIKFNTPKEEMDLYPNLTYNKCLQAHRKCIDFWLVRDKQWRDKIIKWANKK